MRILVDHSGYALLNVGDIAMLQACVRRMRTLWPEAEIQVLAESPARLRQFCPDSSAVTPSIAGRRGMSILGPSGQVAAEQMWKMTMPLLSRARLGLVGNRCRVVDATSVPPRLLDAVRGADIVVSGGGGFVNDTFWWYGAGVLSVLAMAQGLGKPTAMFGQGIGPLTHPLLRRLVTFTMPRMMVIGLREGAQSMAILKAHGVDRERVHVTGDDALVLTTPVTRPRTGTSVGLNLRVAPYSGIDASIGRQVVAVVREAARRRGVTTVALPVEHNEEGSDLRAFGTVGVGREDSLTGHEVPDIGTPEALAEHVARCRVVVTGSYHAAVFALAVGIPVVCITKSRYYDGKFKGLAALFPGGCHVVSLGSRFERELAEAIDRAWDISEMSRDDIHAMALAQVAQGDHIYERFKSLAAPWVLR